MEAHAHLSRTDKHLAGLIERVGEFQFKLDECDSVYESLLEAIMHQSIAGKAAQAIYARIVALGTDGRCPTPARIAPREQAEAAQGRPFARESRRGPGPRAEDD